MGEEARNKRILILDGILLGLLVIAALSRVALLLLPGIVLLFVIMFQKGFLRFPRVVRAFRNFWGGLKTIVVRHRLTKTALRNIAIVVGIIVVIVVLNQLKLAAPGKGRGLSVPMEAFAFDFSGVSSPGQWIATSLAYALLLIPLGLMWLRLGQDAWPIGAARRGAFVACLVVFIAMPFAFMLIMLGAPDLPDPAKVSEADFQAAAADSQSYSETWLAVILTLMCAAVCIAVAIPHYGNPVRPARAAPQAISAPVAGAAPAPPTPPPSTPSDTLPYPPPTYQPSGSARRR